MVDLRNFRDAAGEAVQPYFAAYMIERGFRVVADVRETFGNMGDYLLWNSTRWREFSAPRKIDVSLRTGSSEEFTDWLQARSIDFAARNFIEAA